MTLPLSQIIPWNLRRGKRWEEEKQPGWQEGGLPLPLLAVRSVAVVTLLRRMMTRRKEADAAVILLSTHRTTAAAQLGA